MSDTMTMPELIARLNRRIIKDGARIAELEEKNERLTKDRAHFSESYAAIHARFAQQQTKLEQAERGET